MSDYKIINTVETGVIPIPVSVCMCPYCEGPLVVDIGMITDWFEDPPGSGLEAPVDLCAAIDCTIRWKPKREKTKKQRVSHTTMPYVYWVPVSEKVLQWLNATYRFDHTDWNAKLDAWKKSVLGEQHG